MSSSVGEDCSGNWQEDQLEHTSNGLEYNTSEDFQQTI